MSRVEIKHNYSDNHNQEWQSTKQDQHEQPGTPGDVSQLVAANEDVEGEVKLTCLAFGGKYSLSLFECELISLF